MKKRILFVDDEPNILEGLRRWFTKILCAVIGSLLISTTHAEDTVYSVGIVPQFEARRLYEIWRPIFNELETQTGLKFKLQGSPTISDFEREFMSGTFDFTYMNPYHMMLASDHEGYIPLVRDNGKSLHGVLVVRKGSNIQVEDLANKVVAFPAPNALGASLQMRQEFTDKFSIRIKPRYVKTHDSVYLNVAMGQTAAGGGVMKTLNRQPHNIRNMLEIIHQTTPVSPHPLAVHPRVPVTVREKVRSALLTLGDTATGKQLLAKIPIKQIGAASIEDYLPLKEMNLDRFYVGAH